MFCIYCGKSIDDDSRFCVYCGNKFDNVVEVKRPNSAPSNNTGINQKNNTPYQASVCPCCGAPVKSYMTQCEYCDTPFVANTTQSQVINIVPQTVQVVAQPVNVVAQPASQSQQFINDFYNQQIIAQNNAAQKIANAQIASAAIRGGAEVTGAVIRSGVAALFHGLF